MPGNCISGPRPVEASRQCRGASEEVMELCAGGELYDRWADKGREDGVKQDEQKQALASYLSDGASDQRYASSRAQKHGLLGTAGGYFNEDEATTAVRQAWGPHAIGV